MTSLLKTCAKPFLRSILHALPPTLFRRVVHVSPPRFLRLFNQWDLRDKYPCESVIPHELWDISAGPDGHMRVQGCDCVRLAEQYGTPLHVVDKNRLKKNFFVLPMFL